MPTAAKKYTQIKLRNFDRKASKIVSEISKTFNSATASGAIMKYINWFPECLKERSMLRNKISELYKELEDTKERENIYKSRLREISNTRSRLNELIDFGDII